MAMRLRQSTSVDIAIGPFLDDTDGKTPETSLTITQPDIRLKKNNGNWAQKNASQTLTHEEAGWYEVTLDATDTNTLGQLIVAVHESGALPVRREFEVVPANVYDAMVLGSDALQVDAVEVSGDSAAADNLESACDGTGYPIGSIVKTTTSSGTTTTLIDSSLTEADANYWAGRLVLILSGSCAGQIRPVFGFTPASDTITVSRAFTQSIGSGVSYALLAVGEVVVGGVNPDVIGSTALADTAITEIALGVWNAAVVDHDNVAGSFGLLLADVESDVTAIKAKTDNLPADTAAVLTAIDDFVDTEVAAILAAVDTEVAAIKAKTDNLPSDPADASVISGEIAAVQAVVDDIETAIGTPNTSIAADIQDARDSIEVLVGNMDAVVDEIIIDTVNIQSRLPASLVSGRMDSSVGAMASDVITEAAIHSTAWRKLLAAVSGTATSNGDAGGTTIVDTSRTEAATDYWKDSLVVITSGACIGQVRPISAFNASTDTITVSRAFTAQIASGVTYSILRNGQSPVDLTTAAIAAIWNAVLATYSGTSGSVAEAVAEILTVLGTPANASLAQDIADLFSYVGDVEALVGDVRVDTENIQSRLPASLVSGRIDASVGAMADNTVTASAIASNAFAAAKFASDFYAAINAEVVDTLGTDTLPALTQAAPSATPTIKQVLVLLNALVRNKQEQSATQYKMYLDDESTVAMKQDVSENSGTLTRDEMVTGP